jgi:hypothetical protein
MPSERIRKKHDLIRAALGNGLDEMSKMLIKDTMNLLDHLETKVEVASQAVTNKLQMKSKDLAIVMSIPGIGFVSG